MYSRAARKRLPVVSLILLAGLALCITGCPPTPPVKRGVTPPSPPRPRVTDRSGTTPRVEPEPAPPAIKDVWPPKAIWVARASYQTPQEIVQVMDNCYRAGFNTVLFQVRGEGTVYYPSQIEPWAGDYAVRPPSFDPLAVACREAHRRGMALHAWANVMPAWRGDRRPTDPRQLYNAHPEWFWYDQRGRRQPLGEFYLSINPCLPEVRSYLVSVMREIITRYPVDGLHMDYIRFPMDEARKGVDYPYDQRTVGLYRAATGKYPQAGNSTWVRWRTDQVTQLVRDIRAMQKQTRPKLMLSAACGSDLDEFKRYYFQDGSSWLRSSLIDLVFVMNYNTSTSAFRRRQEDWRQAVGNRMVVAGIGEYMHKSDRVTAEQLRLARAWGRGFAVFSYASMFAKGKERRIATIRPIISAR